MCQPSTGGLLATVRAVVNLGFAPRHRRGFLPFGQYLLQENDSVLNQGLAVNDQGRAAHYSVEVRGSLHCAA